MTPIRELAVIISMKPIILIFLVFSFFSCKKERVKKHHSEFIGYWKHTINLEETQYISVYGNGKGMIEWWKNGKETENTTKNYWYIKDNYFILSIFNSKKNQKEAYKIYTYPTTATNSFVAGYDSINKGVRYMVLNGNTFYEWTK